MLLEIFLPDFTKYLIFYFCLLTFALLLGFLNTNILNSNKHYSTIITNGLVPIVVIYSIIWTFGQTIMFIPFVLYIIYIAIIRRKTKQPLRLNVIFNRKLIFVCCVFLISYILFYYIFFIRTQGDIFNDHSIYANMSYVITATHIETNSVLLDNASTNNYHYFDLWLTSFAGNIFHANYLYVLLIVTYPLLSALLFLSIYEYIQSFVNKNKILIVILSLLFFFYKPLLSIFIPFADPIITNPKNLIITIIFIYALSEYRLKNYFLAEISILSLVSFYSPISPGILVFLVVLSFLLNYKYSAMSGLRRYLTIYSLLPLFVFFAYIAFYIVVNKINGSGIERDADPTGFSLNFSVLQFTFKKIFRVFVLIIPSIIILFVLKKRKVRHDLPFIEFIIALCFAGIISAAVAGVVSQNMLDGYQIFTNFVDNVFVLNEFLILLLLVNSINPVISLIISIILAVFYYQIFFSWIYYVNPQKLNSNKEIQFYKKIELLLEKNKNSKIGYFRNFNIARNKNSQYCRLYIYSPLTKMPHFISTGYYAPISLSILDLPECTDKKFDERRKSGLWRFYDEKIKSNASIKKEDVVASYIVKNDIKILIVEKDAVLPSNLIDNTKFVDSFDQVKVYMLN